MWRKKELWSTVVGIQVCVVTMENRMEVPQKLKIELPYDAAILLLGMYLKKIKALIRKDTYIPMFTASLFTTTKIWNR